MTDLIARLEAASEGSRELSDEVARGLGWTTEQVEDMWCNPVKIWLNPQKQYMRSLTFAPDFTRSIDAAITAVPGGFGWEISVYATLTPKAIVWDADIRDQGPLFEQASASTAPLALCAAALKARMENRK